MFSAKDRMNYRYFHKRAHYLAVINKALIAASKKGGALSGVKARWGFASGDERRPVIILRAGKGGS
jgi:U3 small nucleolar RNA-associated protein 22